MEIKLQLQSTKKERIMVTAYYTKLKELVDGFSMDGQPVSKEDFIMHLLQGLSFEYDVVITNINSQFLSLEIEDVTVLLLD